jgi:hypothetical protein
MKRIRKKGQTEDFLADMIPSMIIIVIGLFILSSMQNANEESAESTKVNITEYLMEKKTIADHLDQELKVDGKNIPLKEIISLSYKNENYQTLVEGEVNKIQGEQISFPDFYSRVTCLSTKIVYPDDSIKIIEDAPYCAGTERVIYLPTFEGKYLTMKFTLGIAVGQGSSGV